MEKTTMKTTAKRMKRFFLLHKTAILDGVGLVMQVDDDEINRIRKTLANYDYCQKKVLYEEALDYASK